MGAVPLGHSVRMGFCTCAAASSNKPVCARHHSVAHRTTLCRAAMAAAPAHIALSDLAPGEGSTTPEANEPVAEVEELVAEVEEPGAGARLVWGEGNSEKRETVRSERETVRRGKQ